MEDKQSMIMQRLRRRLSWGTGNIWRPRRAFLDHQEAQLDHPCLLDLADQADLVDLADQLHHWVGQGHHYLPWVLLGLLFLGVLWVLVHSCHQERHFQVGLWDLVFHLGLVGLGVQWGQGDLVFLVEPVELEELAVLSVQLVREGQAGQVVQVAVVGKLGNS
jgi:hypothetical protein